MFLSRCFRENTGISLPCFTRIVLFFHLASPLIHASVWELNFNFQLLTSGNWKVDLRKRDYLELSPHPEITTVLCQNEGGNAAKNKQVRADRQFAERLQKKENSWSFCKYSTFHFWILCSGYFLRSGFGYSRRCGYVKFPLRSFFFAVFFRVSFFLFLLRHFLSRF